MGTRHDAVREISRDSHGSNVPQNVIDGGGMSPPHKPIAPPHSPPCNVAVVVDCCVSVVNTMRPLS
jgi:hypothetical protein